jgi:hypothetical protein
MPRDETNVPENVVADAKIANSMARFNPVDADAVNYDHILVPISRIVRDVAAAMQEDADYMRRVSAGAAREGRDAGDDAMPLELTQLSRQLVLIEDGLDKIREGKMPNGPELRALKGDIDQGIPFGDDAIRRSAQWAEMMAQERHDATRLPAGQRSRESQEFYDLTDRHFPQTDGGTIPGLMGNYASVVEDIAMALPDPRARGR